MAHKRRRHSQKKNNNYFNDTMNMAGGLIGLSVVSTLSTNLFKK